MIKFFRHIRQRMIKENRVSKYLLYAIGEIVLVVIGIMIALSINTWNHERIDRNEEQDILRQLKSEVLLNREQLLSKIERRKNVMGAGLEILEMIDHPEITHQARNLDSLLFFTMPNFTFDPSEGMMTQLVQGGKLSLIQNDSLRLLLSNWSSMLEQVKEEEEMYATVNLNHYRPCINELYSSRNLTSMMGLSTSLDPILLSEDKVTFKISRSKIAPDHNILLRSNEFEGYLSSVIQWNRVINIQSQGVLAYIEQALRMIDGELKVE